MTVLTRQFLDNVRQNWEFAQLLNLARSVRSGLEPETRGLAPNLGRFSERPAFGVQVGPTYFEIINGIESGLGVSSFDFRLGGLVAMTDTILDGVTEKDLRGMKHWRLESGQTFEFKCDPDGNNIYYLLSQERVLHSADLDVEVHSRSTTGRLGCHSKGVGRTIQGNLITILQPLAFNLTAKSGETSFSQGVVRYAGSKYATPEQIRKERLVSIRGRKLDKFIDPLGLVIKFDTKKAYAARKNDYPIDLSAPNGSLDFNDWWELIEGNSQITLDGKRLYLLGSQGVMIFRAACGIISKEQKTYTGLGGFGCLAGVVQPGFAGGVTMEPYFPNKTVIRDGSVAGHILVDSLECVDDNERNKYSGDYQGQRAPRLPKMFRE